MAILKKKFKSLFVGFTNLYFLSLGCENLPKKKIPSTLWVSTFYVAFVATSAWKPMMQFVTLLLPLCEMLVSTWDENNYMHFLQPHSNSLIDKLILCSLKLTFAS